MRKFLLIFGLFVLILPMACQEKGSPYSEEISYVETEEEYKDEKEEIIEADLFLAPNEAGQVMILMYHRFGDTESEWQRTWSNFRRDLERLYESGYRLISIKDYLNNSIDIPVGYSPVILTFDDGYTNQFSIEKKDDEWVLKPQTAVGIMQQFYNEYPDFGMEGIFYVNSYPFGASNLKTAVDILVNELGMDLGNHTRTHINMKNYTAAEIEAEVGGLVKDFKAILPDYEINSLALPYGVSPPEGVRLSGIYEGVEYENKGVLLVGANPAYSPVDKRYNPLRIPRIRGDEDNLNKWLEYFEENKHLRYVSDGDTEKITVPSDMLDNLNEDIINDKRIYIYDRMSN